MLWIVDGLSKTPISSEQVNIDMKNLHESRVPREEYSYHHAFQAANELRRNILEYAKPKLTAD